MTAKEEEEVEFRRALWRVSGAVSVSFLFGVGVYCFKGAEEALEFFAGYLVEQSLSIDNLFVMTLLFDSFKVPVEYQGRVLTWGIFGAVCLRALALAIGVPTIRRFRPLVLLFAGVLLISSWGFLGDALVGSCTKRNRLVRFVSAQFPPVATTKYDGDKFFTTTKRGRRSATPLFVCLVAIELSDFIFALNSIPAVLSISSSTFVVFASNILSVVALRSLYTLVARAISRLVWMRPAVSVILAFVGLKLLLEYFSFHISTGLSLLFISATLTSGVLLSLISTPHAAQNKSE